MIVNWSLVILIFFIAHFRLSRYISFCLICAYVFLRGDYGNDYHSYYQFYTEISNIPFGDIKRYSNSSLLEIGWVFANWIFSFLGLSFQSFILLWNIVYLFLLNRFITLFSRTSHEYSIICLLWLIDPDFILTHFSLLRQAIPILIYYIAFLKIEKINLFKIALIGVITIALHNSSIVPFAVLFLFYLMNKTKRRKLKFNNNRILIVILSIFLITFLFIDDFIILIYKNLPRYQFYFEAFQSKDINGGLSFLWMYLIGLLFFVLRSKIPLYEKLLLPFLLYLIIAPLALYLGAITRISFYFQFSFILVLLEIYRVLRYKYYPVAFVFLFLGCVLPLFYKSYGWFHQPTWIKNYLNYF